MVSPESPSQPQHPMPGIAGIRREYISEGLHESELDTDPIVQFERWFQQAIDAGLPEVNGMALATADTTGRPSVRMVLLKGVDERGFVFFTNYNSRKGHELDSNPFAALAFHWPQLTRQIRIEGSIERVSAEESDAYFQTRSQGSRVGAWASRQSSVIASREELQEKVAARAAEFADGDVPRPDWWGGYRLIPEVIEFWHGQPSRLHDRLVYQRTADGGWDIVRLSP